MGRAGSTSSPLSPSSCATALVAPGAVLAQLEMGTLMTGDTTCLVGGDFFSLAGYSSVPVVAHAARDEGHRTARASMRWWRATSHIGAARSVPSCLSPDRRYSRSASWRPLPKGSLPLPSNGSIRAPNNLRLFNSSCPATSRCSRSAGDQGNLHASGDPSALNVEIVNWESFTGAVCFAVGGVIQVSDRPTSTRTVVQHTP
jgi:hypothetical protein